MSSEENLRITQWRKSHIKAMVEAVTQQGLSSDH